MTANRVRRGVGILGMAAIGLTMLTDSKTADAGLLGDSVNKTVKSNLPPEVGTILGVASDLAGAYTGISTAIGVVQTFLHLAGILSTGPDPVAQQFAALNQHLDATAGTLTWFMSAQVRENRLADGTFDVISAREIVASTGLPLDINSATALDSGKTVAEAEQDIAFQRYFIEGANNGIADWKSIIPDRPAHQDGVVYDWRLGVPALMRLISLRIQIMAAIDPNFQNSGVFREELIGHRNALMSQIAKMTDGVRCNDLVSEYDDACPRDGDGNIFGDKGACALITHTMACADIYTGTAVFAAPNYIWTLTDDHSYDPVWYQTWIQSTLNSLRRELLAQLPLAAMYKTAGSLLRYEHIPATLMVTGGDATTPLAVANSRDNGTFSEWRGETSSDSWWSLEDFASFVTSSGATPIRGDFDRDGRLDVALVGPDGWQSIPVAFDQGDGTFRVTNEYVADFPGYSAQEGVKAVGGDFNGDGFADIALMGGPGWASVPVALSHGDGTFEVKNRYLDQFPDWAATPNVTPVAGDFDGDGRSDIALAGGQGWGSIPIAFSNSDGTFSWQNQSLRWMPYWASLPGSQIVGGDFNGDGLADIAVAGFAADAVPVAFSNGDGSLNINPPQTSSIGTWAGRSGAVAVTGDFNADGLADIALTGSTTFRSIPIAVSNGDGSFGQSNRTSPHFASWATQTGAIVVGNSHPSQRQ